jgi:hypothetical protein
MKKKSITAIAALLVCLGCAPSKGRPQPPPCAQNLLCLLNQEAAANDPAAIHKYTEDLIGLIVPNRAGQGYVHSLADRLARAEQAAREGRGKLIPEAAVAHAFNDLMTNTGAPDPLRADVSSVERARRAFEREMPAVISQTANGSLCNPGEAVWVVSMLVANIGRPAAPLSQLDDTPHVGAGAPPAQRYLDLFYAKRSQSDVLRVFDNLFHDLQI